MIGTAIRKYAEAHAMTCEGGYACGKVNGRHIVLMDGYGVKLLQVYLYPPACTVEPERLVKIRQALTDCDAREFRLIRGNAFNLEDGCAVIVFQDGPGAIKRVARYIDEILPRLDGIALDENECACCGGDLNGDVRYLRMEDHVVPVHSHCARGMAVRRTAGHPSQTRGSILRGMLGALLGAVLGAIPWAIVHAMGFVAGFVGLIIGGLANFFYGRFGGRESRARVAVVVAAMVLGVMLGQTTGTSIEFAQTYAEKGGMNAFGMTRAQYIATCWDQYLVADQAQMLSNMYDRKIANIPENMLDQCLSRSEFIDSEWSDDYQLSRTEAMQGMLCDMGVGLLFGLIGCISLFARFSLGMKPGRVRTQE